MILSGVDGFQKKLAEGLQRMRRAAAASLYEAGYEVMGPPGNSLRRVPVKTGRLRATGYVSPPIDYGTRLEVTVGYGTDYAAFVHERTDLKHPVGEAKFLQNAIDATVSGWADRLSKRAKDHFDNNEGAEAIPADLPTDAGG